MPHRPRTHQIEALSRRAFEAVLGPRFVYRREDPDDYGIDGTVEEFEARPPHAATGLRFHVQLKATDEPDLSRSLAVSINRATSDYYRSLTLPVLMVRYRAVDESFYARWFHQFDPTDSRMTRTVTFRWEPEDLLGVDTPSALVREARAFLTLRSPTLRLPIDIYLDVPAELAHGLGRAVLQMALRNSTAALPDVVFLRSGPIPPGAIRVATSDAALTANLGNVTTATVLLDRYSPGEVGEQFGIDAMVVVALAFEHVGRTDIAARLASAFLAKSSLVTAPEVAWGLAFALRRSRRVPEALRLANALHGSQESDRREASKPFLLAALWHRRSLEADELDQLESVLERRIAREITLGDEREAARNSYTLGNLLRSRREPSRAIASYDRALELDSDYACRPYFHEERAGVLFLGGRYAEAASEYEEAHLLGAGERTQALWADALMHAGKFGEALVSFTDYNRRTPSGDNAEWRLKQRFLDALVNHRKISRQARDSQAARAAVETLDFASTPAERLISPLEEALQSDALSGLVWFNLGRAHLDVSDRDAALMDYLGAAISEPGDAEAWVNTVVLAMTQVETAQMADDALRSGSRLVGAGFREYLVRWTQAQDPAFPAEEMLARIDEHLEQLEPPVHDGMLLRLVDAEGRIDELVMRDPDEPEL